MDEFERKLMAEYTGLRAFAIKLTGKIDRAEDCVQTTMLKALSNRHTFIPGTNLHAWLVTILRNTYYSEYRKRKCEVSDPDGVFAASLATKADQEDHMDVVNVMNAINTMSPEHREAIDLVVIQGESYDRVATITKTRIGTVKSRLNRARYNLTRKLESHGKPTMTHHKVRSHVQSTPINRVPLEKNTFILYGERFALEQEVTVYNTDLSRVNAQILRLI